MQRIFTGLIRRRFVILNIVLCAIMLPSIVFAGDLDDKKDKKKKEETDPWKATVIWESIPLTRQGFHSYVDKSQSEADEFDGFLDSVILIDNKASRTRKLTEAIITIPNQTQVIIENLPLDNRDKLLYLKELNVNVRKFIVDFTTNGSLVDEDMYLLMSKEFLKIMRLEIEQKDIAEYVNKNFNLGIYANLPMYSDNAAAVEAVYKHMVNRYPDKMLYKLRDFANTDAADKLIANTAKKSPNIILTYAKSTAVERDIVMRSKDPLVQAIAGLATNTTNSLKALPFIDDIRKGHLSYAEINQIIANQDSYYKQLVKSKLREPEVGENILNRELKHEALESYIRIVNELHDSPGPVRFKVTNDLSATEIYYLMVLCSDEIYTSSFTGLYARMLERMKPQKGNDFLDSLNKDKFRTFIRMSAGYNVLDTFLRTMTEKDKYALMASFVHDIDKNEETDLADAVDVADALASINDEKTLKFLREELKKDYERTYDENNKRGLVIYFLLHTLSNAILHPHDSTDKLQKILRIPPITNVPYADLVDDSGTVFQQHFFYGDEDGKSSLASFLTRFPATNWTVTQSKQWIKIASKTGKPVVIYANQPLPEPADEEAQLALNSYLIENDIKPGILVHRGHSYHLPGTLKYIGPNHRIVILGSCGGYHNLSTILDQSEDAHIISSKQTGTMHVNDPMLRLINDRLQQGKSVEWLPLWKQLASQMTTPQTKDMFNDYVPPHKNMGALFLKAFKIQMADMDKENAD